MPPRWEAGAQAESAEAAAKRAAARQLRIPQSQLFDLWQRHRHALLRALGGRETRGARAEARSALMARVDFLLTVIGNE